MILRGTLPEPQGHLLAAQVHTQRDEERLAAPVNRVEEQRERRALPNLLSLQIHCRWNGLKKSGRTSRGATNFSREIVRQSVKPKMHLNFIRRYWKEVFGKQRYARKSNQSK